MADRPSKVQYRGPQDAVRIGVPRAPFSELYVQLIAGPWVRLIGLFIGFFFIANLAFATLYYIDRESIGESHRTFLDAFFFSVQTISTIGYGSLSPASAYANMLVTMEAMVGLLGFAMVTGLIFAKFSRPSAHVLFSEKIVCTRRHGRPILMLRVANARANEVVEASIRWSALVADHSPEGHAMRSVVDLKLVRDSTPVFGLSWLVMHELDESSPLYGMTPEQLASDEVLFFVTLIGLDSTLASTVHARHMYDWDDLAWGQRFVDIISRDEQRRVVMDFTKFNLTRADPPDIAFHPKTADEARNAVSRAQEL